MPRSPNSPIDVHRYAMHLTLLSAAPRGWVPVPGQPGGQALLEQVVRVKARVREVFKAPPGGAGGDEVEFEVTQRRPASGFVAEDHGPWSELDPLPAGLDLLAFANDPPQGSGLPAVLARGCDLLVRVADPAVPFALDDVRRALALQAAHGRNLAGADAARQAIVDARARSGPLFAGFLGEGIPGRDLADPVTAQAHRLLLALLGAADANLHFRRVILSFEANELGMVEQVPLWLRAQFVRTLLNILADDSVATLHDPIRQAYLANAVFGAQPVPLLPAQEVIATAQGRQVARDLLNRRQFAPPTLAKLIRWLS